MIIKGLRDEDFLQYKLPSMLVAFPSCTFKCEKECNCKGMCQNSSLAKSPDIKISAKDIVARYINNPITKALVCGGLEPFDSSEQLLELAIEFRAHTDDPFIIYTGYNDPDEISPEIWNSLLRYVPNLIIKWGRYIPNQESHYDEVLGVYLASPNQVAEKIS